MLVCCFVPEWCSIHAPSFFLPLSPSSFHLFPSLLIYLLIEILITFAGEKVRVSVCSYSPELPSIHVSSYCLYFLFFFFSTLSTYLFTEILITFEEEKARVPVCSYSPEW